MNERDFWGNPLAKVARLWALITESAESSIDSVVKIATVFKVKATVIAKVFVPIVPYVFLSIIGCIPLWFEFLAIETCHQLRFSCMGDPELTLWLFFLWGS